MNIAHRVAISSAWIYRARAVPHTAFNRRLEIAAGSLVYTPHEEN